MNDRQLVAGDDIPSFVAGEWITSGTPISVLDKFTGNPVATTFGTDAATVARAVQHLTPATPSAARDTAVVLRRTIELVSARREEFVRSMAIEAGFTASDTAGELERGLTTLELSAQAALTLTGEVVSLASAGVQDERLAFTVLQPKGIVAAITPFNSPFNVVLHKIGPALAAGNAVILKPSEHTPMTAVLLVRALLEAGLPATRIALVNGAAETVTALLENPSVAFYAFTGSTHVGQVIAAGAGIRGSQLELGSISSTILCADADLDTAIPKIARAAFRKAGQVCTSVQRLFVHTSLLDDVAARLTKEVGTLTLGDPLDAGTVIGPVISERDAKRMCTWVSDALTEGAKLLAGGEVIGSLVPPTLLLNPSTTSKVYCEEVFGPVLSITPFSELPQALSLANDTDFGLAAGIFTANISDALSAASELNFGSVFINETSSSRLDSMPFGGVKSSGRGKEGPEYAARQMSDEKLISLTR